MYVLERKNLRIITCGQYGFRFLGVISSPTYVHESVQHTKSQCVWSTKCGAKSGAHGAKSGTHGGKGGVQHGSLQTASRIFHVSSYDEGSESASDQNETLHNEE